MKCWSSDESPGRAMFVAAIDGQVPLSRRKWTGLYHEQRMSTLG